MTLDDAMFGDYNPYRQPLFGDWLAMPSRGEDPDKHPGMVFLNGRALYEVTSLEDTFAPRYRDHVKDYVTDVACAIDDPEMTQCVWYARVEDDRTVLYANFHGADPNEECVEIAVRRSCFFPRRHHVNYITVSGFELCQAATQWAPPTSHQVGAIGPNWATGWIIERNLVHDVKCSGISWAPARKQATTNGIGPSARPVTSTSSKRCSRGCISDGRRDSSARISCATT